MYMYVTVKVCLRSGRTKTPRFPLSLRSIQPHTSLTAFAAVTVLAPEVAMTVTNVDLTPLAIVA